MAELTATPLPGTAHHMQAITIVFVADILEHVRSAL
jgi:hypothetical protein